MSYNNLSKYDKELISNIENEVLFLCNEKIEYETINNAKLVKIFKYSDKKGVLKILSYLLSIFKLFVITLTFKPDIIHYQWLKLPNVDFFIMITIRKLTKAKLIFTAHNLLPHDSGDIFRKIFIKIYTFVDAIIVHTNRTKEELIKDFNLDKNKIIVIPHGLLESNRPNIIKKNCKEKSDEISLAFIGHLHHYKGIDLLIDAWKKYHVDNNGKLHLTIAGKGNVDFKGINFLEDTTIINRFLEEDELTDIIQKSDVIIMPYRKISQSGVLLSVLSYRKAIIVTDVGGLTEPFKYGDLGWIMNEATPESLIEIFKEVTNSKDRLLMIENNIDTWNEIDKYYSWDSIGKKTKSLYIKLI
jgi:glycosyltransferase involved in cell wall biosynthesis